MREAFKAERQAGCSRRLVGELVTPGLSQAQREATSVIGVLRTFDQAGPDQHVDRPADGWCAPADVLGDLVERCRLRLAYRRQQFALGALGTRRGPIRNPVMGKGRKARRKCCW